MKIYYFYYYHGEETFINKIESLFKTKNYKGFVDVYKQEQANKYSRLPQKASLYIGNRFISYLHITNKFVFKHALTEYEWG